MLVGGRGWRIGEKGRLPPDALLVGGRYAMRVQPGKLLPVIWERKADGDSEAYRLQVLEEVKGAFGSILDDPKLGGGPVGSAGGGAATAALRDRGGRSRAGHRARSYV